MPRFALPMGKRLFCKYPVVHPVSVDEHHNEADKRVYEILSRKFELFDGVFGASDVALGALESGLSFEKTKEAIAQYLDDVEYWSHVQEPEMDGKTYFWQIDKWGEENFGSHGMLFLGAFCNNSKILFPILLLCDENGEYIDFEEHDIVSAIEKADDQDIHFYKPSDKEMKYISKIYRQLTNEMLEQYKKRVAPVIAYNRNKVENWIKVQTEQLSFQTMEMNEEIKELFIQEFESKNALEKEDIRKKIAEKKRQADKVEKSLPKKKATFEKEAQREIDEFEKQFEINPILLVNIVLKF